MQHRICDTSSIDGTVAGIIQGKLMMVAVAVGHTSVTLLLWQLHMQVRKGCATFALSCCVTMKAVFGRSSSVDQTVVIEECCGGGE